MKAGFTLIELVIGLFISSILLMSLYTSFYLTSKVIKNSEDIISHDIHFAIIANQLEHDIDGIFVPLQLSTTMTTTQVSLDQKQEFSSEQSKDSGQKEIKDIFISSNDKDGLLKMLSFITCNPLQIHHKEGPGSRMVRVVYKLVANEDTTSFSLTRQESTNLDLKAFEPKGAQAIRAYQLTDAIKSIEVTFKYPEPAQEKTATKDQKKEKQPVAYTTLKEWPPQQQQTKDKKTSPEIPQYIIFTITLWDIHRTNEQKHILSYEIPSFTMQKPSQKKSPIAPKKSPQPISAGSAKK